MIFVGDVAIPKVVQIGRIDLPESFKDRAMIANLEGAIVYGSMASVSGNAVFNNDIVIEYFKEWNVKGVTLANNYITDVPQAFDRTKQLLSENDIKFCGAGYTSREASNPMWVNEDGQKICILAYGWDVISCRKPQEGNAGANLLISERILRNIETVKRKYPDVLLYIIMHWDIELEEYPMPAHRSLARKIISTGADAVIGHHPHCVQVYEMYKGKPIFYSLGNWMFPQNIFCGGRISFPQYSNSEYAVDILPDHSDIYSFEFDSSDNSLWYKGAERMDYTTGCYTSEDYLGLSDDEYLEWFKTNRHKTKGLPVYRQYDRCVENMAKDTWIKTRQVLVRHLRKYLKRRKV